MSPFYIRLIVISIIWLALDLYIFYGLKVLGITGSGLVRKSLINILYWIISLSMLAFLTWLMSIYNPQEGPGKYFFLFIGLFLLIYLPKLVYALFLVGEDAGRLVRHAISYFQSSERASGHAHWPARRKFISQIGLGLAVVPFFSLAHGLTRGRYRYTIHRHTLWFPDLPDAFDGFRIAQISDIHAGGLDDYNAVKKGVELLKNVNADLITFTGDLVNDQAKEMEGWKDLFSEGMAPYGKYAILGNHNYGDYLEWPSRKVWKENMARLESIHHEMGYTLLKNQTARIDKDGESIYLLGVENWGLPPFPQHGDLEKVMNEVPEEGFKVLMTHDPTHWDVKARHHPKNIHLTLSGHTHGMQFGIEVPGYFKWSPAQWRYNQWAGLYSEAGKFLYVNRGFGCLAFPGRVGIWPEVTSIVLRKGEPGST